MANGAGTKRQHDPTRITANSAKNGDQPLRRPRVDCPAVSGEAYPGTDIVWPQCAQGPVMPANSSATLVVVPQCGQVKEIGTVTPFSKVLLARCLNLLAAGNGEHGC